MGRGGRTRVDRVGRSRGSLTLFVSTNVVRVEEEKAPFLFKSDGGVSTTEPCADRWSVPTRGVCKLQYPQL